MMALPDYGPSMAPPNLGTYGSDGPYPGSYADVLSRGSFAPEQTGAFQFADRSPQPPVAAPPRPAPPLAQAPAAITSPAEKKKPAAAGTGGPGIGKGINAVIQQKLGATSMTPEEFHKAVADQMEQVHGVDIDAAAQAAAEKMGMPDRSIAHMSRENKGMLLLQFGLHTMAAASQPGAARYGAFGAMAQGGLGATNYYNQMMKQRQDEMDSAQKGALSGFDMQAKRRDMATKTAMDEATLRQQNVSNIEAARQHDLLFREHEDKLHQQRAMQDYGEKYATQQAGVIFKDQNNPMSPHYSEHPKDYNTILNEQRTSARLWAQTGGVTALPGGGTLGGAPSDAGGGPSVGTVFGGYKFKGGDPKVKENWEPVK